MMRGQTAVRVLGLVVSISLAAAAHAKETCDAALEAAQRDFDLGRFGAVAEKLGPCIDGAADRRQRAQAWELLARAHLADDRLDEAERAVRELVGIDPGYQPDVLSTPRFARLVLSVTGGGATPVEVSSVSKTAESLLEAPATVVVVTAEEIARRGYRDLEAVLHDLPGFDISRGDGFLYSTIYQRGYRSIETNRTLFLVDGVEENDLSGNTVWLSRQYPLSNVDRVEVVYGPASTIYGANAFLGVINVITKQPKDLTGDERFGALVQVTAGENGTEIVDATLGGRLPGAGLSWTLTARAFRSDGEDLSRFPDWDYDPSFYDGVDYEGALRLEGADEVGRFLAAMADPMAGFADCTGLPGCPFAVVRDASGTVVAVAATPDGVAAALAFDRGTVDDVVGGRRVGFSDPTDDWLVAGKLRLSNLTVGFQTWRREEGTLPWQTDRQSVGGDNGGQWIPSLSYFYVKYDRELMPGLSFHLFSRYKLHELDGDSATVSLQSYATGRRDLADLALGRAPEWVTVFNSRSNNQLRNEISLIWEPSGRFNLVGGLELRNSSIGATSLTSSEPNPLETGQPGGGVAGGNTIDSQDVGAYVQASYRLLDDLKLVAAGRVDNNRVRDTGGFGTAFNPRLALVYSPSDWVFKAMYGAAFQDPPNFQRFQTFGSRVRSNPDLQTEDAENLELAAGWKVSPELHAEVSIFEGRFSNIIEEVPDLGCDIPACAEVENPTRFENVGELRIRGLQAEVKWRSPGERFRLSGNYSYTDPENTSRGLRIRDIASHRANLAFDTDFGERWQLDLRANYVGGRENGLGTTAQPEAPAVLARFAESIGERGADAYLVTHASLRYRGLVPGLTLQLTVDNLFDTEYFHPGVRTADGLVFTAFHPQPRRAAFLRVSYSR